MYVDKCHTSSNRETHGRVSKEGEDNLKHMKKKDLHFRCPMCKKPIKIVQTRYINDMKDVEATFHCEEHGYWGILESELNKLLG